MRCGGLWMLKPLSWAQPSPCPRGTGGTGSLQAEQERGHPRCLRSFLAAGDTRTDPVLMEKISSLPSAAKEQHQLKR